MSELQTLRNRYASARRWDPDSENTRRLGRQLTVARVRKHLDRLQETDRRIVLRILTGPPKDWT